MKKRILIDIGNTNTSIAVAEGRKVTKKYFIRTAKSEVDAVSLKRLLGKDLSSAAEIVIVQVVPKSEPVSQTNEHNVGTRRHDLAVEVVQNSEDVRFELRRLGHGIKRVVAIANVVSDQLQEQEQRLIVLLVARQSLNDGAVHGAAAGTIDAAVLVIAVVAVVPLEHALVHAIHIVQLLGLRQISGVPSNFRPIDLIEQQVEQAVVGGLGDLRGVHVVLGNLEVRTRTVSHDSKSSGTSTLAEHVFPGLSRSGILTINAVAVVIDARVHGGVSLASGIDGSVSRSAIATTPVGSAKLWCRRKLVVIHIHLGKVVTHSSENGLEPSPGVELLQVVLFQGVFHDFQAAR